MSRVRGDENYREAHLHPCIRMGAFCTIVFFRNAKNVMQHDTKSNFRLFCMEVSTLISRQRSVVLQKITSKRHPRLSACVHGHKKRGANGLELPLTRNFTQLPSHLSRRRPMWWDHHNRENHSRIQSFMHKTTIKLKMRMEIKCAHFMGLFLFL